MGAFNPSPTKAGAERGHIEEVILAGLLEADGTALAKDTTSFVWAERFAESRCIAYLHHLVQRMANQWDPQRMSDFLGRWSANYAIVVLPSDLDADVRRKIGAKIAINGQPPTQQVVNDYLTAVLGSVFVGIANTSSSQAVTYIGITADNAAFGYAGGGATIPGGLTIADGSSLGITWYSTIANVDVLVAQPASMGAADFATTIGQVHVALDDILPAWATFGLVADGAHGAGFFLDEPNLNLERFA